MKIIFFISLFVSSAFSQWNFNDFVTQVYAAPNDDAKNKLVDSFWVYAKSKGIPYLEGNVAHFLWRGSATSLYLAGDMNSWSSSSDPFQKLSSTNLYYYSHSYEPDARLDYKFILNGNWILDPNNPKTCSGGYGPNSELSMPGYIQPPEIEYNASVPQGQVVNYNIFSKDLNQSYVVNVYLPPSYPSLQSTRYPSIYVQDGSEYITLGYMVNVLNNLIYQNRISEIISVFIKPNNRNDEYAGNQRFNYEKFLVNQLVPFIDSVYRTINNPNARGIMGASYGGNISTFISYRNPAIFGLCGNHSPAYQPNSYEVRTMLLTGPKKDIRFYLDWGTYEPLGNVLKPIKDTLIKRGYSLEWKEWHEGHSWGSWRAHTDNILEFLFPFSPSHVKNTKVNPYTFKLNGNFPNPFNPVTKISFSIYSGNNNEYTLKIYDFFGREIKSLFRGNLGQGEYVIDFNGSDITSGTYLIVLSDGKNKITGKMILLK